MNTEFLRIFIPLFLVFGGLYLKQTKNESDQSAKKYWTTHIHLKNRHYFRQKNKNNS